VPVPVPWPAELPVPDAPGWSGCVPDPCPVLPLPAGRSPGAEPAADSGGKEWDD